MNKTWRVYAISPILSTVNEQSFINSLVPSLRQEYEKYSGPLNNVKLLRVLVHEIEAIQGFDYCVGYNLSFTDKDRAISLYCCIFAQYPRSTHVSYDEIEYGDKIRFAVVKDVYKNGKLYIKKGTPVYGIVDYVNENGWAYDNAQIDFKEFRVKNIEGKVIKISSPVSINGFEILKYKGKRAAQFFNYCGVAFRGKEVEIIPEQDNLQFNVWLK